MILNLALILLCSLWVIVAGRRSLVDSFCVTVGLLVALPDSVRINLGGSLPALTIHRVLLLIVLAQWLLSPAKNTRRPPFFGLLILVVLTRAISTAFSVTPIPSAKDFLGFVLEIVVFYRIAYAVAITYEGAAVRTMQAAVCGLAILAGTVIVERYTSFDLLGVAFPDLMKTRLGAQGTYPHRILFGYAMAMGVPLALCLLDRSAKVKQRAFLWAALCLMAGACYFSMSRGPWLGLGIAMMIAGTIGEKQQRQMCRWIGVLALITCMLRPGVWTTIANRYGATFDTSSHKGKSYQYRYKLWQVAGSEIAKSPKRTLFGYGGVSTNSMDLSKYFEAQAGGTTDKLGYTSWDNRYASDLIEFGAIGFGLVAILFTGIPSRLFRAWRRAATAVRARLTGVLAAVAVFVFAQVTVDMFSVQLKFLFWVVTAAGFALAAKRTTRSGTPRSKPQNRRPEVRPAVANVGG